MDWVNALSIIAISAFVGYITNWMAVKMLFRPRREWRLWGRRVPFTPGLFPQRRAELAAGLGRAVRKHLLTDQALAERVASPEIRVRVQSIMQDYVQSWLKQDLPNFHSLIPDPLRSEWRALLPRIERHLRERVGEVLAHPQMKEWIRVRLQAKMVEFWEKPLDGLLAPDVLLQISDRVSDLVLQASQEGAFRSALNSLLDEGFASLAREDRSLGELLTPELRSMFHDQLREHCPVLLEQIARLLEDDQIKKRIRIEVYEMVDAVLSQAFREDSLWDQMKLSFLEGSLISADELKARIDQTLDEAGPRLRQILQQSFVRERIEAVLIANVENLLAHRLSEMRITADSLTPVRAKILDWMGEMTRRPFFEIYVKSGINRVIGQLGKNSLSELLAGAVDATALSEWIAAHVLAMLQDEKSVQALTQMIWQEIETILNQPIGKLGSLVSSEFSEKLCELATERLLFWLSRELPQILQTIDVETLIAGEVDKLSAVEIEELVLRVTGSQLQAITWFGALLGGMIGLIQVLMLWAW
jgi:uncharacterized membrane protein YheB (UPF0754 family)